MNRLFIISLCLFGILFPVCSSAQEDMLKGREFWISSQIFCQSSYSNLYDSAVVFIFGDTACTGFIENPHTGYYQTFSVVPNTMTSVKIPTEQISSYLTSLNDTVTGLSVCVKTTANVSVYFQGFSFISQQLNNLMHRPFFFNVPKIPILPKEQYYTSYYGNLLQLGDQVNVIATEDNTLLNYTVNNIQRQITLNRGDVFTVNIEENYYFDVNFPHPHFSSNCKKFNVLVFHKSRDLFPAYAFSYPQTYYQGKDLLMKKCQNNLFWKILPIGVIGLYSDLSWFDGHNIGTSNCPSSIYLGCDVPSYTFNPPFLTDRIYAFVRATHNVAIFAGSGDNERGYNPHYSGSGSRRVFQTIDACYSSVKIFNTEHFVNSC